MPSPRTFQGRGHLERGSALIVVLLTLLILSTIGMAMVFMGQTDHLSAANDRDAEQAQLASRAGLNLAYQQFLDGSLTPSSGGAPFDSTSAGVNGPLRGATFSGRFFDDSASTNRGHVFRIVSTGTARRASRTTELVVQVVPEAFRFGYTGFSEVALHNHSGLAGPSFRIESTVFSNGPVSVPDEVTLDGSIVAARDVDVGTNATIKGSVFANSLSMSSGSVVEGNATMLTAVEDLSSSAGSWDRVDAQGGKYDWWAGSSSPGSVGGSGTIVGSQSSYAVLDGDVFRHSIFRRDGRQLANPNVNVVKFIEPPRIDYRGLKLEADANDPTYFTSITDAMTYLASKKVVEVIDGKTLTTIKVGTPTAPELIFMAGDFKLELDPDLSADNLSGGKLKADGFHLEGGFYVSGDFSLNGPAYDPVLHPAPPDYYQFKLNALPHCFPAIVNYPEPGSGTVATWTAADTPPMTGGGVKLEIKSSNSPHEGFVYIHGVIYTEGEIHMHHAQSADELIRFIGAELAWKLHNCDYFHFTYDPDVVCTRFLVAESGTPQVVSYREVR